jgi:carbonic anhydrase
MTDNKKEDRQATVPASEALLRLRDGNARFVDGDRCIDTYLGHTKLDGHLGGQSPFAVVLGCSDSRVPVEIIFDVGLGDLFVIRVAGNIVAPSLIGSVELAAAKFGARLVVVLGHTGCGAIEATVDEVQDPDENQSTHINAIVECVRPSVEKLLASGEEYDRKTLMEKAIRLNVSATVRGLLHGSETLERLIREQGLMVVGAEYSLESGIVDFFEGVSGPV